MNILIIGGGGREHAIAWRLSQDPRVGEIWSCPGNPGFPGHRTNLKSDDHVGLLDLCLEKNIALTVVGPEVPLFEGLVDFFRRKGQRIFGPTKSAAELERNKIFSKEIMKSASIPTAESRIFGSHAAAHHHVESIGGSCVVKFPGPAQGKGAFVCSTIAEASEALRILMIEKPFGEGSVLIEEKLTGQEASFYVVTDGDTLFELPAAQDHKTIFDGDRGPMTGGMGAYAPAPVVTEEVRLRILREIAVPLLHTMKRRGTPYTGVLFIGLMITASGPKVIEFNCRFGDPETQPIMMLWEEGLLDTLLACSGRATLEEVGGRNRFSSGASTCVVMASAGYPATSTKGCPINLPQNVPPNVQIFQAGTRKGSQGLETDGGRVLGITAKGATLQEATDAAYAIVNQVSFEGRQYRRDIGHHALELERRAGR
ncbi:MAG: phosphoribosylamine--glycine ligase [Planctomycetota bacterium]